MKSFILYLTGLRKLPVERLPVTMAERILKYIEIKIKSYELPNRDVQAGSYIYKYVAEE